MARKKTLVDTITYRARHCLCMLRLGQGSCPVLLLENVQLKVLRFEIPKKPNTGQLVINPPPIRTPPKFEFLDWGAEIRTPLIRESTEN